MHLCSPEIRAKLNEKPGGARERYPGVSSEEKIITCLHL